MRYTHRQVFALYAKSKASQDPDYSWSEFLERAELARCDDCGIYGIRGDDLDCFWIDAGDDLIWYCSDSCESELRKDYGLRVFSRG